MPTSIPVAVPRVPLTTAALRLSGRSAGACFESFLRGTLTTAALRLRGRWWWFCDESVMREGQPVLITELDKYDVESDCYFTHPWSSSSARWKNDHEQPNPHDPTHRFVRNWTDCFHGPCLSALDAGFVLRD